MKLNLGCGKDYRDGFVNLDRGHCRADVIHDLNTFPYPFNDDQFSYILAHHALEHINRENWFAVVRELHRISKLGAIWEITSPYALSDNFFTDPTHSMPLTTRSFDFFDATKSLAELGMIYGVDFQVRVLESKILENRPNGPDVYFKILVLKGGEDAIKKMLEGVDGKAEKENVVNLTLRKMPILRHAFRWLRAQKRRS